ncbi:hypothetical protein L5515_000855 [Caenorhabditis briggsae]|uniref:Uncharacterized protein n=1 Tax=Caenorhabditis briggsae TaxID=6238 RepID=A0AAE9J2W8_CAEBR|nr:hypothetical protein L3Y34_014779 [Caenorhabditis briggsae]UMM11706.1 hypothetical protein L5515_000855 [Caenorhabditis briggsae]
MILTILLLTILSALELICYSSLDFILKKFAEKVAELRGEGSIVWINKEEYEETKMAREMENKKKKESQPEPRVLAEETEDLLHEVDFLKRSLKCAEDVAESLKKTILSQRAEIEKHRRETEEVRNKFEQSEKDLQDELQDIVNDLIAQEKKRRQEYKDARDEEAFDRLEDISDEFGCEIIDAEDSKLRNIV